jgi:hypothetical protein
VDVTVDVDRPYDLATIARSFEIEGSFVSAVPYGTGHINDTFAVSFEQKGATTRYILQRINHGIFKDPAANMENIRRVTEHLARRLSGEADAARRVLTLIPARDGEIFYRDSEGNFWRMYLLIENAVSLETATSPEQAFEAGRAFGEFQQWLTDLPGPRLNVTIPDFHHVPKRFATLERAIEADTVGRASLAQPEIQFALAHQPITDVLLKAGLPERVTHNDTKFSNVLLDKTTGRGLCVIDLDTVMPGLALYDFGDMVRTTTSPAAEDERDLSRVHLEMPMFESLLRGYLSTASEFLTPDERRHLAFSGTLITFVMGIRFLTDYLSGDTYYKVHREGHNLDRCRTQFRLIESIERQEETMNRLVESFG